HWSHGAPVARGSALSSAFLRRPSDSICVRPFSRANRRATQRLVPVSWSMGGRTAPLGSRAVQTSIHPLYHHVAPELRDGTCNGKEVLSLDRGRVGAVGLPRISAPLASPLRCRVWQVARGDLISANGTRAIGSPSIMICQCDSTCGRLRY